MSSVIHHLKVRFSELSTIEPLIIRAPGRINLIGEHTDYNDGFVLPAAVSHSIHFAVAKSGDPSKCSLISLDFDQRYDFDLSEISPLPVGSWQNYILGVASEIMGSGRKLEGFNLVFTGNIPKGSGMSSSAALECGACFGLSELFDLDIPKIEMAKLSQMAEHHYAGVKCGIMDQFASVMGKSDHAILLDCRSLDYSYFPIGLSDYRLLLFNSNVTHSLASSEYNVRREQCEAGVEVLRKTFPGIKNLRDATMNNLLPTKAMMDDLVFARCKYVIEENERVDTFSRALSNHDLRRAGYILNKAHYAMRHEYEITCPEIDFIADNVTQREEVLGARMMGGGFGGCVLTLIRNGTQLSLAEELNKTYEKKFRKSITPIEVEVSDGVSRVDPL